MYDAIVVGAGHNGLVTAGYLARAGWKVLVVERRGLVGGACVSEPVWPGYTVSTAAYLVSLLQEKVVRDLELRRFGYEVLPKDPAYFAPFRDGRHFFMYADQRRTCEAIAQFSERDAERYPAYEAFVERLASFVEPMLLEAPPNVPPRSPADLAALGKLGARLLRLKPREVGELARMFSSSARDVLDGWFESEELKLALATDGVIGTNGGPSTPGTAYVLLHHVMGGVGGVRGLWGFVRGGMGALSEALKRSAQAYGAEIRTDAEVAHIEMRDGAAIGVVLAKGDAFRGTRGDLQCGPKRTFLGTRRARAARAGLRSADRRFPLRGILVQDQPRARRAAQLFGAARAPRSGRSTAGRPTFARVSTASSGRGTRRSSALRRRSRCSRSPSRRPTSRRWRPTAST